MISTSHFPKSSVPRAFELSPPSTPSSSSIFSPLESIPFVVSDGDSDSSSEVSPEPSPKLKKQYSFKEESASEFLRQKKVNDLLRQETVKVTPEVSQKQNKDDAVVFGKKTERKHFSNKIGIAFATLPVVCVVFFTQFLLPKFLDSLPGLLRKHI